MGIFEKWIFFVKMTDLKEHEDSLPEWSTDEDDEEVEMYTRPDPVEDAPEAEEGAGDVADGAKEKVKTTKRKRKRRRNQKHRKRIHHFWHVQRPLMTLSDLKLRPMRSWSIVSTFPMQIQEF